MNSHEGDTSGIMYLDGVLLMDEYLYTRREQLDWIVAQHEQFRVEQVLIDDPAIAHAVYQTLLDAGHEGVMLKNRDSLYFSGKRCKNWLKIKPIMETLEIGRVGIGINDKQLSELTESSRSTLYQRMEKRLNSSHLLSLRSLTIRARRPCIMHPDMHANYRGLSGRDSIRRQRRLIVLSG